jgi:hypothetical protein
MIFGFSVHATINLSMILDILFSPRRARAILNFLNTSGSHLKDVCSLSLLCIMRWLILP